MRYVPIVALLLTSCGSESGPHPAHTPVATVENEGTIEGAMDSPPSNAGERAPTSSAGDPSQPTPREPIAWLVLEDIQGLFGGDALYVWADGRVLVRVVRPPESNGPPGLRERRYETRWNRERLEDLSLLLAEQDFARLVVEDRPGIPDEARADIRVRWESGRSARAAKWDGQRDARFGEVQSWLMARIREAAEGRPVREGQYDYADRPEGPWTAGWVP